MSGGRRPYLAVLNHCGRDTISNSGGWVTDLTWRPDEVIILELTFSQSVRENCPNSYGSRQDCNIWKLTGGAESRGVATKFLLGGGGRIHRHPNPPTPKL